MKQPAFILLAFSVLAWLWRGVDYALIGSIAPLVFILVILALLALGWARGGKWWSRTVRLWGLLLFLLGIARVVLAVGLTLKPSMSMHGVEALTLPYHAMSLFHLVAGAWLLWRPPAKPPATPEAA